MKANVLFGVNDLRYVDTPNPEIKDGWVLVKVLAAGVCGSDVPRVFSTGTYHFPTIIGHEFAGVVEKVNPGDEDLLGKRVAVFPLIPCKSCDNCKTGNYELCSDYNYLGSRCDGGFAEYVAVPKWNLMPIDDRVSIKSAAMFEPAAVALHALRRVKLGIGDTIAIVGPGTIGCIMSQLAKIGGASKVVLIGRSQKKLEFAKNNFGVSIINSITENVEERILEMTGGKGVDIAVEGTGAAKSMDICFDICRKNGRVLAMGNPLGNMELNKASYWKLLRKQLTIIGTWNSSFGVCHSDWDVIVELVKNDTLKLEKLITHTFPLSGLIDALNIMRDKDIYSNKVMILND